MSDCVLWEGAKTRDGYGRRLVRVARGQYRNVLSHRWAWEQVNGPIPKGYEIHHTCGNKACVNVDHMELLTRLEHRHRHPGPRNTHPNKKGK